MQITYNQIRKALDDLGGTLPRHPVKGRDNKRFDITDQCETYEQESIWRISSRHIEAVAQREKVNRFGKLSFVKHIFVSPELLAILDPARLALERFGIAQEPEVA